ncbi:MAG: hypothetical protein OHK0013_49950 [Sandaracinaceae bacterium]
MRQKPSVMLATVVTSLLVVAGCGGRARSTQIETASTEGDEASSVPAAPQTPEELDAAYREQARHLVRNPVWDSPLRTLSAEGLEVLRRYRASRGDREEVLSLEVVSPDWEINRHRATGAVLNRWVAAITTSRFPDGSCYQYGTTLAQEYVGGDFASTLTTQGTGGGASIPCETIDAIAAARPDVAR